MSKSQIVPVDPRDLSSLPVGARIEDLVAELSHATYRELTPSRHELTVETTAGERRTLVFQTGQHGTLVRSDLDGVPGGPAWSLGTCSLHVEQSDRGSYFLGFYGADDGTFAFNLATSGYLDAHVDS